MNYFGARYYDPELGSFTSTDPAEEFYNLYSYTGCNPVNFIDPNGLSISDDPNISIEEQDKKIVEMTDHSFPWENYDDKDRDWTISEVYNEYQKGVEASASAAEADMLSYSDFRIPAPDGIENAWGGPANIIFGPTFAAFSLVMDVADDATDGKASLAVLPMMLLKGKVENTIAAKSAVTAERLLLPEVKIAQHHIYPN